MAGQDPALHTMDPNTANPAGNGPDDDDDDGDLPSRLPAQDANMNTSKTDAAAKVLSEEEVVETGLIEGMIPQTPRNQSFDPNLEPPTYDKSRKHTNLKLSSSFQKERRRIFSGFSPTKQDGDDNAKPWLSSFTSNYLSQPDALAPLLELATKTNPTDKAPLGQLPDGTHRYTGAQVAEVWPASMSGPCFRAFYHYMIDNMNRGPHHSSHFRATWRYQ